jgi:non-specific serine/threonine protein kinase/serine/threonine-protein kinase
MSRERWQHLEDVFHAALDRTPADRVAFVVRACGGDAELRQEVERLLHAHEQATSFAAQAAVDVARVAATVPSDGHAIGAYRIVRELGRGGMGAVYLGERADAQFRMRVAIKVIKRGMDTDAVLQRFRHERQILAGLEHRNIARLLDGGTTGDGVPYFVMEYVDGQPIDEYCRARRLPIDHRLDLFRQVCAAVAYAHQNLVVHRDIKPSNILVTSERIPKLLDFGIAKLLDAEGGDMTLATEFGRQAMTPQYASPEQLRGDRVTTVSDVYSLGVLLYELLADARPYETKDKSADEIRQIVADTELVKPSAMTARVGDHAASRRLRGDLDTIVTTAMRKDPAERYASVALFAEDIRRHIEGLPVVARGDSWTYRTGRFVRRRKLGVAAAAAIVSTLVGGVIATSWQARVAKAERARAERRFDDVRKLANSVLFDYHDAIAALPGATAVRERLVRDALAYLDSLAAEATGDSALQRELAAAYDRVGSVLGRPYGANLGNMKGALQSYQKALRIREALVAADARNPQNRRELAESHRQIGWQLIDATDTDAIQEHFRQAISIYTQLGMEHPDDAALRTALARAHNQLGSALEGRGDFSGALENERRALTMLEEVYAASPGDAEIRRTLSITYEHIARALFLSGEVPAALENNGRALALRAALASEDPTNATFRRMVAISYQNDGDFRDHSGDSAGALASFRRKLAIDEELLAADPANVTAHGDLAYSLQRLADILTARGSHADALLYYRRAAEECGQTEEAKAAHLGVAKSHAGVARAQASLGNRSAALEAVRRAETITRNAPDDRTNSGQRGTRAEIYEYMAETYRALATRRSSEPADAAADSSAACNMFQRSHDIWEDMRRRGILSVTDAAKPDKLAKALGRCHATPGEPRHPRNGAS